jgi:hypothetical protein
MTDKTVEQIFLGKDNEPLTDELIEELIKTQGIPENDLRELQKMGATYCRPHNSFFTPPEFNM